MSSLMSTQIPSIVVFGIAKDLSDNYDFITDAGIVTRPPFCVFVIATWFIGIAGYFLTRKGKQFKYQMKNN